MARETGVTVGEYLACEAGESDLTFAFLYRCALALNVDITDIIEGASPTLTTYTITRNGAGQRIERAHGMIYYNLAPAFKHRTTEPLRVTAIYDPEAEQKEIEVTTHVGQECDIVHRGLSRIRIGDHTEILHEGDTIYYDSSTPHGMIAVGGQDCIFYAIVINPPEGFVSNEAVVPEKQEIIKAPAEKKPEASRIWENYVSPVEDENGQLLSISFKNQQNFNFAYDVVEALAAKNPDKLAMLHIDREKNERRFTFGEISRLSSRAANYFRSLGIKKGDRLLLVLRRHWQFWISMIALNKAGAVALLGTDQLVEKDFEYVSHTAGFQLSSARLYAARRRKAKRRWSAAPS
jgi:acetyl-CoA synthetase